MSGNGQMNYNWVVNLSMEPLTKVELSVTRKELNVVPMPSRVDSVDFISDIDNFISKNDVSEEKVAQVRFDTTKALQAFNLSSDKLTVGERRALHELKKR